jgi:hypothetical protein
MVEHPHTEETRRCNILDLYCVALCKDRDTSYRALEIGAARDHGFYRLSFREGLTVRVIGDRKE